MQYGKCSDRDWYGVSGVHKGMSSSALWRVEASEGKWRWGWFLVDGQEFARQRR